MLTIKLTLCVVTTISAQIISEGSVRLVDGEVPHEGRVEVYHDGRWGTICHDSWDDNDASVICRQLGYGITAVAYHNGRFGTGSGHIWLDEVDCTGSEKDITKCGSLGWGVENCLSYETAGVRCGSVRLRAGSKRSEGRVEVLYDGRWGTVCADGWDDNDASVVCRQLGHTAGGIAFGRARFGRGSGKVWLDDTSCDGSEAMIEDCGHRGWGQHNCSHDDDAGVRCRIVRLVGGEVAHEGRVEVYHEAKWGGICGDSWDDNDASVVCRQLGYGIVGKAYYNARFGPGSDLVWLYDVYCTGSEDDIRNCRKDAWRYYSCEYSDDIAGVICGTIRFLGGSQPHEGRVEVLHDGQWGTVCDDGWDDTDASVVCRQLAYPAGGTAFGRARYGEGSGQIWLDDISCDGSKDSIENCEHGGWGQHDCDHGEDAGVRCNIVRLVGGLVPHEGRVEVYRDRQWGRICDDSWDDLDASVICRQLGYGDIGVALRGNTFGTGFGRIWLDRVDCIGNEDDISNCQNGGWGDHRCTYQSIASVVCGTVRLVDGETAHEGRVEIYQFNQWGRICDYSWDDNDATVVCRQLGYADSGVAYRNSRFGTGFGRIWLDDVDCIGTEDDIRYCRHRGFGVPDCGHNGDAGVYCGTLRLLDGSKPYEGRVEIYHDGEWGTVCDDGWDDTDASVACRQLGYTEGGTAFGSAHFGSGWRQIWLDDVSCDGSETRLENCRHRGWRQHNCSHQDDAGVRCKIVRLVGGEVAYEGRVEVYHDRQWGTICDDSWDDNDASVFCRQLDYGVTGVAYHYARFGPGSGPIWLDEVHCTGNEDDISNCRNLGWAVHSCDHHEDAGVVCGTIRLRGGSHIYEGRVELLHNGQWGTICDDGWDDTDASVVCLQLGYTEGGTALGGARYGRGSGRIWLDDVYCVGSETKLENCRHKKWGKHNCDHGDDAGVRCQNVRIVGGEVDYEGRVEVYHDKQWGTICDDSWDYKDASVICRQLGYGNTGEAFRNSRFGPGSGQIWLDDVDCRGNEDDISDCRNRGWGVHDCNHNFDAGVYCGEIRLRDGSRYNEGRVEVYHNGQWGTVCDDSWDDTDASVVCRQLGYTEGGTAFGGAWYGRGSGQIWLDDVYCDGFEKSIKDCSHGGLDQHDCSHGDDAGVQCTVVRLVDGDVPHEGRVEVYHNQQWGTICDDSFDDNDASVICRQLGYGNIGKAVRSYLFEEGSGQIWLDDVDCTGNEDDIRNCGHRGWGVENCIHFEDAAVICDSIRLVNGSKHYEGRVEVLHDGRWGTVCDNGWDDTDAAVACLQLGYTEGGKAFRGARYGRGSGQIWMDDIFCDGSEDSIDNCQHTGWGQHNCSHGDDAGVRCQIVRLVGGAGAHEGRVEVFHDKQWGSVCDDSWDEVDASVICRQLGYGNIGEAFRNYSFAVESEHVWLENVECSGNEDDISDCRNRGWGVHNCNQSGKAGVYCGKVRIRGGSLSNEGRVEVYNDGQWGTVCNDGWDDADAFVVCRQLGFLAGGTAFGSSFYSRGSLPIWLNNISCYGNETSIEGCSHGGRGQHECDDGEDAAVRCRIVRLVSGVRDGEGNVEIYHDGQWGTICDNYWGDNDASVICRQLGYGTPAKAYRKYKFPDKNRPIWLDNVDCTGSENDIRNCRKSGWGIRTCGYYRDAGATCGTIRLLGGSKIYEGRVEVLHDGRWGTVCDDGWDDTDASVVCRQLGYIEGGKAFGGALYGRGSGQIWMDDISCDGSEERIDNCRHRGWGQHNCSHGDDAGVRCQIVRLAGGVGEHDGRVEVYHDGQWGTICDDSWDDNDASVICRQLGYENIGEAFRNFSFGPESGHIWLQNVDCSGYEDDISDCRIRGWGVHECGHNGDAGVYCGTVRINGGARSSEGRIEVYYDGQWGTVCNDGWNDADASVVCRQLGFPAGGTAFGSSLYSRGSLPIWVNDISCYGNETSIEDCFHEGWGQHGCDDGEDAAVRCINVRLAGGGSAKEGRVEIFHDGQWGTICNDLWDNNAASVICRQLGYGSIGKTRRRLKFGRGSGPIWLDDVDCTGSEDDISNCQTRGWGVHNCNHREDVGVYCEPAVEVLEDEE